MEHFREDGQQNILTDNICLFNDKIFGEEMPLHIRTNNGKLKYILAEGDYFFSVLSW